MNQAIELSSSLDATLPSPGGLLSTVGAAMSPVFWTVAIVWALWVLYLAVMNLKGARDGGRLGPVAYALGVPTLVLGYLLDFIVNVSVCTPLFLELPQETTVTARLKRHAPRGGWRGRVARWMAEHLLDPFDPDGRHV